MGEFAIARHKMVESQVRPNGVTNGALLAAMLDLPRERFIPAERSAMAYVDEDIPLGHGRYVMEPMVLARLLQVAEVRAEDVALDVGCATGYASALLARLCTTVVALDSDHRLATRATAVLTELGADNVVVVEGPLATGYPRQAPYDVILINGAVAAVPDAVLGQLAEGGRLVTVVRRDGGVGRGTLFIRSAGVCSRRAVFDAATPVLPGFEVERRFVF